MAKSKLILGEREDDPDRRGPPWQRTNGMFLAGQSEVTETDTLAMAMERKWGAGRLRLLVGPELREKFDRQRYLLNQAIWHGELEEVRTQARRMRAAWSALDKAATDTGQATRPLYVWEAILEDGSVAAIVQTDQDAAAVIAQGRAMAVYTMDEIGRLLSGFPALAKAKEVWNGASVVAVRVISDPLDGIHDTRPALDDEIPF